jgi:hypothetical protein
MEVDPWRPSRGCERRLFQKVLGGSMPAGEVSTLSAVFSAIGGSIVGGTISTIVAFVVQKKNLDAAKAQRDGDRFENRKARAYSLFFKMIRVHSTIAVIDASMTDFVQKGKAKGMTALWQMVLPLGNMPDRVKFTPDEMALLLSSDIDLFNDLGPYDEIHNSLLDIYETYGSRRTAVLSKFGTDEMDGGTGTHALSAEEVAWLTPRAYELNNLAAGMIERAKHDRAESKGLLERIHALFVKEFGLNPKLEFREPTV